MKYQITFECNEELTVDEIIIAHYEVFNNELSVNGKDISANKDSIKILI